MLTILILTTIAGFALFAAAVIAQSLVRHGPAIVALRRQLRTCDETRELRTTVSTLQVRRTGAVIYRPAFTPQARPSLPVLRAA